VCLAITSENLYDACCCSAAIELVSQPDVNLGGSSIDCTYKGDLRVAFSYISQIDVKCIYPQNPRIFFAPQMLDYRNRFGVTRTETPSMMMDGAAGGYDYYGHFLVRHQLSYPNM
jgi:hypothetical protein